MTRPYEYALGVTSQFYYCGLPLRLDTYSRCGFQCLYCFSHARGGHRGADPAVARPSMIAKALARSRKEPRTAVEEFLSHGQPIHFGGMADPFPPIERRLEVSLEILKLLASYQHPTIISTKSILFAEDQYLEVLKRGRFAVQISLSSPKDEVLRQIDIGTPGPSRLLSAARTAADEGIPVTCRVQPILPGYERDAKELIWRAKEAGARHVAVEHLKLPLEGAWWGSRRLHETLRPKALAEYELHGLRIGREWVLPSEAKIGRVLELREEARAAGLTFGAADNDLLLLSDGTCCCSGADLQSFTGHFSCNYTEAARLGAGSGVVSLANIRNKWRPKSTIARFVNSRSRLPTTNGQGAGMWDYIVRNWNGRSNGNSPAALHGVSPTNEKDDEGFSLYELHKDVIELIGDRVEA